MKKILLAVALILGNSAQAVNVTLSSKDEGTCRQLLESSVPLHQLTLKADTDITWGDIFIRLVQKNRETLNSVTVPSHLFRNENEQSAFIQDIGMERVIVLASPKNKEMVAGQKAAPVPQSTSDADKAKPEKDLMKLFRPLSHKDIRSLFVDYLPSSHTQSFYATKAMLLGCMKTFVFKGSAEDRDILDKFLRIPKIRGTALEKIFVDVGALPKNTSQKLCALISKNKATLKELVLNLHRHFLSYEDFAFFQENFSLSEAFRSLEVLTINSEIPSDIVLNQLAHLPSLRVLNANGVKCKLSPKMSLTKFVGELHSFADLKELPETLKELVLRVPTSAFALKGPLSFPETLKNLEVLTIHSKSNKDIVLPQLTHLPSLRVLNAHDIQYKPSSKMLLTKFAGQLQSFADLKELPQTLKKLIIMNSLPDVFFPTLGKRLPDLEVLGLAGGGLTSFSYFKLLRHMPKLQELHFSLKKNDFVLQGPAPENSLTRLSIMVDHTFLLSEMGIFKKLESLKLHIESKPAENFLQGLRTMSNLKHLEVFSRDTQELSLKFIETSPSVRCLNFEGLSSLKSLDGIEDWKNLKTLYLPSDNVTEDFLRPLEKMPQDQLKSLTIFLEKNTLKNKSPKMIELFQKGVTFLDNTDPEYTKGKSLFFDIYRED